MATNIYRLLKSSKTLQHGLCNQHWQSSCMLRHAPCSSIALQQQAQLSTRSYSFKHPLQTSKGHNLQQQNTRYAPLASTSRWYSTPQRSNSFFGKILENLKDEAAKNTEMKKNIEGFKKDMEDLASSETAVKAREKFNKIEEERAEGSRKAFQQLGKIKEKVSKTVEDAQNIEMIQKASKITGEAKEKVQQMGQKISEKGEQFSQTRPAQTVRHLTREVGQEIQASALSGSDMRVYKAPSELRMRKMVNPDADEKVMEENTSATGMVLHKDSRFSQSWQDFKDNNPYVTRVMEWKTKLDESDHFIVRASALVKDKVTEIVSPMFNSNDLSKTLTEICLVDPDFDKDAFLFELQYDIIPNIMESMYRPELKVLKDWTYERAYSMVETEIKHHATLGHHKVVKVLEVEQLELQMGQMLDHGPMLAVNFQAQVIETVYDKAGDIVSGSPDTVMRQNNLWVFCRDQTELNPREAWRLLEFICYSSPQLV